MTTFTPTSFTNALQKSTGNDLRGASLQLPRMMVFRHSDGSESHTEIKSIALCMFKETEDIFFQCKDQYSSNKACLNLSLKKIDLCENINAQDIPLFVCMEVSNY